MAHDSVAHYVVDLFTAMGLLVGLMVIKVGYRPRGIVHHLECLYRKVCRYAWPLSCGNGRLISNKGEEKCVRYLAWVGCGGPGI